MSSWQENVRSFVAALAAATWVALSALSGTAGAQTAPVTYQPTKASLDQHPLPGWWSGGKFGVMIHWGPYAVPGWGMRTPFGIPSEWYWYTQQLPGVETWEHHLQTYGPGFVYDDFIPQWRAQNFDPDAWIRLFEEAGAKYFVLTTKHHDGFGLWCTKTTHRDACDMGPDKDLVGELFAAARRAGDAVKPGLYYSIPEWFTPAPSPLQQHKPWPVANWQGAANVLGVPKPVGADLMFLGPPVNAYTGQPVPYTGYEPISDYATGQVTPQLHELIDDFHPYVLWCDIGGPESYYRSNANIAYFYNQAAETNPGGVVVNSRCGDSDTHRDYKVVEATTSYTLDPGVSGPTETAQTMGVSWGYDQRDTDASDLSAAKLVGKLVSVVAEGSNFLLNIGPKPDGTIPDIQSSRLRAIGAWLAINGEAIYDSHPWTTHSAGDVRFTVGSSGLLYATSLSWPGRELTIDAPIPTPPGTRIVLLGSDERPLAFRNDGSKLVVAMPADTAADSTRSQNAYTLRIGPPPSSARG